jgi:hypothetical protein
MKCRGWGHMAAGCLATKDTCGICGEEHRTSACNNNGKVYCVSCKTDQHASRDRACPEFIRRCTQFDERHPDNAMQYYPTDQDWTYALAPSASRVPLGERFPQKFAVNSLPIGRYKQTEKEHQQSAYGEEKAGNQQKKRQRRWGQNTLDGFVTRTGANLTPIGSKKEDGEILDEYDRYLENAASEPFDKPFEGTELNKENGWY